MNETRKKAVLLLNGKIPYQEFYLQICDEMGFTFLIEGPCLVKKFCDYHNIGGMQCFVPCEKCLHLVARNLIVKDCVEYG